MDYGDPNSMGKLRVSFNYMFIHRFLISYFYSTWAQRLYRELLKDLGHFYGDIMKYILILIALGIQSPTEAQALQKERILHFENESTCRRSETRSECHDRYTECNAHLKEYFKYRRNETRALYLAETIEDLCFDAPGTDTYDPDDIRTYRSK